MHTPAPRTLATTAKQQTCTGALYDSVAPRPPGHVLFCSAAASRSGTSRQGPRGSWGRMREEGFRDVMREGFMTLLSNNDYCETT